ncbi:MFS transporter [Caldisericum exile]|uniref:Major facilitator superfamily protein n=1 Tax=Caldisericum exile (strain DSM 21853 / NBRC 104410 / AZM16c01) TaxID=511051 RepID=A0A7U6GFX5_CALEA|nr:MFS transporter [Caldisericum exile]BAL81676.1 major facilitator superfamily protein [Caldisericum exile AZM16c01]
MEDRSNAVKPKANYKKVFLLGMSSFSDQLFWGIYNTDIPIIVQTVYHLSNTLTGWVMNIDNILGLFLLPLVGMLSDRTNTKIGKRMPYILGGLLGGAFFFFLISLFAHFELPFIYVFLAIFFAVSAMSVQRSPTIALMADITPKEDRAPANSIMNLMTGIGGIFGILVVGMISSINRLLGFFVASIFIVIGAFAVFFSINEKRDAKYRSETDSEEPFSVLKSFGFLFKKENTSLLFLLFAVAFGWIGVNTVETFYTAYMSMESGLQATIGEQMAKLNLSIFFIAFIAFSVPAGFLGKKYRRKLPMLVGLLGLVFVFGIVVFVKNYSIHKYLFALGGILWDLFIVNAIPTVIDFGTSETQGTYTGFYYLFSQTANIIAPVLAGSLADVFKTKFVIFPVSVFAFIISFTSLIFMRRVPIKD